MAHWRSMMDRDFLYAFDLQGRDVNVTIEKVTGGKVGHGKKSSRKPLMYFRGSKDNRPLALNATNCKTIAQLYGNDTAEWTGKRITLYPGTTQFAGEEVECIRVRPRVPGQSATDGQLATLAPIEPTPADEEREPGSDG